MLGLYKRRYRRIPVLPQQRRTIHEYIRTRTYTRHDGNDKNLAQSAHDRSMPPRSPSFSPPPLIRKLLLGCAATTAGLSIPPPVNPSMLLCAQRSASYHAAAPFFVRPCCRCLDSSPVPLVPFASVASRRKRERCRKGRRRRKSGSGKKWRHGGQERILHESTPRRSFCLPLPLSSLLTSQRFRRVFTPALLPPSLLSSPLRLLESASLFFFPRFFFFP